MKKFKETYVEFYITDDTLLEKPVSDRTTPKTIPIDCECYRFFDKLIVVSKSTKSIGKAENISKWIKVKRKNDNNP